MGFFNRVAGLLKRRAAPPVVVAPPSVTADVDRAAELRAKIEDMFTRSASRGYLTATHRTSHRTVAMDLRDAKKRRNIAKRNKTAQHNGKRK